MELRDLSYFLACVEAGHVTRAAERLHVSQPTLSHALARLEGEVGQPLLERPRKGKAGMQPTPAGEALARRARRALAEVQGYADDLAALEGALRGELRIGSMQTLNSTLLPRPLAEFAKRAPLVETSLHTYAAELLPKALREGQIELGLFAGAPAHVLRTLESQALKSERFVAIVRRSSRVAERALALRDLREEGLILPLPGTFTSELIEQACHRAGFQPKILLRVESGEAIREVVRAGLGIAILTEGYLASRDRDLRAVPIHRPQLERTVHAVWHPEMPLSRNARAFLEVLAR